MNLLRQKFLIALPASSLAETELNKLYPSDLTAYCVFLIHGTVTLLVRGLFSVFPQDFLMAEAVIFIYFQIFLLSIPSNSHAYGINKIGFFQNPQTVVNLRKTMNLIVSYLFFLKASYSHEH